MSTENLSFHKKNRLRLLQRQLTESFPNDKNFGDTFSYDSMNKFLNNVNETYLKYNEELKKAKEKNNLLTKELKTSKKIIDTTLQQYEFTLSISKDGFWDWNCISNSLYCSPRWKEMLGYEASTSFNKLENWINLIHENHKEKFRTTFINHLKSERDHFEIEYQIRHKNGSYHWMLAQGMSVRDTSGKIIRLAGSQTDVTLQKKNENQFVYVSSHDRLTELPNRFLFSNRLEKFLNKMADNKTKGVVGAVIILDLDRFKVINDSLGHHIGDSLLISVGQRLKKILRPRDTLSRLGGDEFAFLLEDINSASEAEDVADRVAKKLENIFCIGNEKISISASIGIVLLSDFTLTADLILRYADLAMYEAKSLGRRRYCIYNTETQSIKSRQFQLEKDLQLAIENNELFLLYQPVVNLNDFSIHSFEALMRWEHKTLGTILPEDFIFLAEESGLIIPLGQFALKESSKQLSKWKEKSQLINDPKKDRISKKFTNIGINVNISINQLSAPNAIDNLLEIIDEFNLQPFTLKLEITESSLAQNMDECLNQIKKIREKNIEFCIDDFGTGFSSLNCLHSFPFDYIKIDASFIKQMLVDKKAYRMVAAIINLAHDLSHKVVAEGVESQEEVAILQELNCDYAQGYYFSPPVSIIEAEKFVIDGFPHINGKLSSFFSQHKTLYNQMD